MNKKELVKEVQEKLGEHYFELLQFGTIINLIKAEVNFSEIINSKIDELLDELQKEADKILDD